MYLHRPHLLSLSIYMHFLQWSWSFTGISASSRMWITHGPATLPGWLWHWTKGLWNSSPTLWSHSWGSWDSQLPSRRVGFIYIKILNIFFRNLHCHKSCLHCQLITGNFTLCKNVIICLYIQELRVISYFIECKNCWNLNILIIFRAYLIAI